MPPDIWFYLLLAGIGVATGSLTGLTGASGMSILISLLLLVEVDIRHVIGLTFVVTLANALVSVWQYRRHGNVDHRVALLVAAPAVLAVLPGHRLARNVEPGVLGAVMVAFLFVAGIRFLMSTAEPGTEGNPAGDRPPGWALILMGLIFGLIMGIMGGGGAIFIGAAFMLLFRMPTKTAIGTSVLIMGVAALPGVAAHALSHTLRWGFAAAIVGPSIPAAWAASRVANRVSPPTVKRCLGVYLVIVSTVLTAKYLLSN